MMFPSPGIPLGDQVPALCQSPVPAVLSWAWLATDKPMIRRMLIKNLSKSNFIVKDLKV
jgi:hypothetical protein